MLSQSIIDSSFASNYFEMKMINNAIFGEFKGLNEFNDGCVSRETDILLLFLLHYIYLICVTV